MSSKSEGGFKQSSETVLSHVWYQTTVYVDVTCMFRRQIGIAISVKSFSLGVTSEEYDFMMCLRSHSPIWIAINSYRMLWRRWRQRNKWLSLLGPFMVSWINALQDMTPKRFSHDMCINRRQNPIKYPIITIWQNVTYLIGKIFKINFRKIVNYGIVYKK